MGPKIKLLAPDVADQIAAGEVVERPANAAKELVENALDAQANRVDVAIEGGGLVRLSVTDDGEGMSPQDALLAIRRHATSKIASVADLERVQSYGFRGEGLPAIASVSRLTLTTRPASAASATRIHIEGGAAPSVAETGAPHGTRVEVADLFYNVPARRKFARSAATESAHITEVVMRAALCHPGVRFTLSRGVGAGLARDFLPAPSRLERVHDVFTGVRLRAAESRASAPIRVEAYLCDSDSARPNASGLHVFVNLRPVVGRTVLRTVLFAYGNTLRPGTFPVGALFIAVDPALVDVNVHPQKAEVRFAQPQLILDEVTRVVGAEFGTGLGAVRTTREQRVTRDDAETQRALGTSSVVLKAYTAAGRNVRDALHSPKQPGWQVSNTDRADNRVRSIEHVTPSDHAAAPNPTCVRLVGTAANAFLVVETDRALLLVDAHQTRRHALQYTLHAQLTGSGVTRCIQLFPKRIRLTRAAVERLKAEAAYCARLGFDIIAFSEDSVALHALPDGLQSAGPEELVAALVASLETTHGANDNERDTRVLELLTQCLPREAVPAELAPDERARYAALVHTLDNTGALQGGALAGGLIAAAIDLPSAKIDGSTRATAEQSRVDELRKAHAVYATGQ